MGRPERPSLRFLGRRAPGSLAPRPRRRGSDRGVCREPPPPHQALGAESCPQHRHGILSRLAATSHERWPHVAAGPGTSWTHSCKHVDEVWASPPTSPRRQPRRAQLAARGRDLEREALAPTAPACRARAALSRPCGHLATQPAPPSGQCRASRGGASQRASPPSRCPSSGGAWLGRGRGRGSALRGFPSGFCPPGPAGTPDWTGFGCEGHVTGRTEAEAERVRSHLHLQGLSYLLPPPLPPPPGSPLGADVPPRRQGWAPCPRPPFSPQSCGAGRPQGRQPEGHPKLCTRTKLPCSNRCPGTQPERLSCFHSGSGRGAESGTAPRRRRLHEQGAGLCPSGAAWGWGWG